MKLLKKYILLLFLFENLLVQSSIFGISSVPFYLILGTGLFLMFFGNFFTKETIKKCWPLYVLSIVYVLYQFTLGIETVSSRSLTYLLAKITTFVIICVSVTSDWQFYARKAPLYLAVGVFVILLYGMNSTGVVSTDDRLTLGFTNTNTTSSLSALCLGTIIFFWNKKRPILYGIMAICALYAMLAGGGRNAILMFAVMMFVWAGFSLRRIIVGLMMILTVLIIVNVFSVELAGISRIEETISGDMGSNRELEVIATEMMIDEKPITGWGFEAQNVGRAAFISEMSSHNGYLETIKFMGYPFAIMVFFVIFYSTMSQLRNFRNSDPAIKFQLAVVLSHLVGAMFEGLFVGVHEFSTNIIFYSLAVLTTYRYYQQKHITL